MLKAGVGISNGDDAFVVGEKACSDAIEKLGGATPQTIFVFGSVTYDQKKMIEGVRSVSGDALVVGASTAGEITGKGPSRVHSVVVMAIASDSVKFVAHSAPGIKTDPHAAGKEAALHIQKALGDDLKFAIMFADGLSGNGSAAVRGILETLGTHFPVVGGSAGDDANYKQTFQYLNGDVLTDSIVVVGVGGSMEFAFGVNHGWMPVGLPMKITKSEGAILKEVNNRPAIALYEDYFGPEEAAAIKEKTLADLALLYPIGFSEEGSDELLLRAPFFVNADGSIVCGGEVPEGVDVRLMVGSKDEAITAAGNAAKHAREQLTSDPALAIIFSCHVRDRLFGTREKGKEEIDSIQNAIGTDVPLIGFYTYAEQAPVGGESRNIEKCNPALHNETVVICLITEK